jgi:hypothetical protein
MSLNRAQQMALAQFAAAGDAVALRTGLVDIAEKGDVEKRGTWAYFAHKFVLWIDDNTPSNTPFSVWSLTGNTKLPFASFSTAPIVTCPGAGACADFCYSFKAWRYPAAYFRQVQNTLLMALSWRQDIADIVGKSFLNLPPNIACRLYVDGDFSTWGDVGFWMRLLEKRPDLAVYGYSKSWRELLEYDRIGGLWPSNYLLNLSNGSNCESLRDDVARLPIVRGNFLAVGIDKRLAGQYGTTAYKTAVRAAAAAAGISRPFVCPGKCGACTPKGHLCGRKAATSVNVVIGVH